MGTLMIICRTCHNMKHLGMMQQSLHFDRHIRLMVSFTFSIAKLFYMLYIVKRALMLRGSVTLPCLAEKHYYSLSSDKEPVKNIYNNEVMKGKSIHLIPI